MTEQGIPALLKAAREMADAIDKQPATIRWERVNEWADELRVTLKTFRALDHPSCPHGCIGGMVRDVGSFDIDSRRPVVEWPCPIHSREGAEND